MDEPKPNSPDDSQVILFETSPYGNLDAIIEHDGRCVYFYLNGHPQPDGENRFGTRAVWVRNLIRGPLVINQEEMKSGLPPMLPRTDCVSNEPGKTPLADELKIVWFEEGNGAALTETDSESGATKTIAIIPPWSGLEGFHGYALDCAHDTQLCSPMPDNETLQKRLERADEFWRSFTETSNPFSQWQPQLLSACDTAFGKNHDNYFAIDGGKFPPRGLGRYNVGEEVVLVTIGMSLCPQPAIELFVDDPTLFRRIELAVRIPNTNEEAIESTIRALSGLASYPWTYWTWLGPGHTASFAIDDQVKAKIHVDDKLSLPNFRDDPVNILWLRGDNEA